MMKMMRMMRIAKLVKQFSQLRLECVRSWESPVGTQGEDIYQLDTVRSSSPPHLRIATIMNQGGKKKLQNNVNCKRLFSDTLNPDKQMALTWLGHEPRTVGRKEGGCCRGKCQDCSFVNWFHLPMNILPIVTMTEESLTWPGPERECILGKFLRADHQTAGTPSDIAGASSSLEEIVN